jgi:hypothetical protein
VLLLLSLSSAGQSGVHPATAAAATDPVVGGSLAGVQVLPPDNAWNHDISNAPVDPNSANLIRSMGLTTALHPDFGTYYGGAPWGIPYVTVSGAQAKVPVTFTDYPAESDPGPYPVPLDAPVEGGPNGYGDRHVIVVDRDNGRLYELFNAFPNSSGWNASCGAVWNLGSNAQRPAGWTSADAAGLPIFPGLVRYEEAVELAEIRHALRFTAVLTRKAYVYPATHFASTSTDVNRPPMGARVRLKASYDISGFSPNVQVILRALKRYGMILADNGGNWFLSGAPDPRWNDAEIDTLKRVKGGDFEVIQLGYPGAPTASAPAAPAGLEATAGNAQVGLTWSTSAGATSYAVKRSTTSGSGYATLASGLAGTSYSDTAATNGTPYYYVVTASSAGGQSGNSTQVSATPAAPGTGALRVNAGGSSFTGAGGVFGADQYASGGSAWKYTTRDIQNTTDDSLYLNVRYGTSFGYSLPAAAGSYKLRLHFAECFFHAGGRVFNVDVNGSRALTNFDIAGATGGLNRPIVKEFDVTTTGAPITVNFSRVIDNALVSAIELIPSGPAPAPAPPVAPSGLQATAGNAQVSLTWSTSVGATAYTVKRSITSGSDYATLASGLTGTGYTDTTAVNGTTYYYVVTASNAAGESDSSAQASATPVAPSSGTTILRINAGGTAFSTTSGLFAADQYATGGSPWNYTLRDILNTTADPLYTSVRYGTSFSYALPATAGTYKLRLHFAECFFWAGARVFHVDVNGSRVLTNFDIAVAAGGLNRPIVKEFTVTSTGAPISVNFNRVVDNALVSAIELVPAP